MHGHRREVLSSPGERIPYSRLRSRILPACPCRSFFGAVRTFSALAGRGSDRCWPPLPSRHARVQFSSTTEAAAATRRHIRSVCTLVRALPGFLPDLDPMEAQTVSLQSVRPDYPGPCFRHPLVCRGRGRSWTLPSATWGAGVFRICSSMGSTS